MKKILPLIALIFTTCFVGSQSIGQVGLIPGANDPSKADLKVLTENRSIISTTVRPTEGTAEGYFFGTDEGSMDINDLKLFLEGMRAQAKAVFRVENPQEPHYSAVAVQVQHTVKRKIKKTKRVRSKNMNLQAQAKKPSAI